MDIVDPFPTRAYVWKDGVMTDLGMIEGAYANEPIDVNSSGIVVGYFAFADPVTLWDIGQSAYVWENGSIIDLGELYNMGTTDPWGIAITDSNQIYGTIRDEYDQLHLVRLDPVTIEVYSCIGFESPMNSGPVTVNKNRVLPLKAQLVDQNGLLITDSDISFPPLIQVVKALTGGEPPIDVTNESLPAGLGTDGNQFVYTIDGKWHYNLMTKNFSGPGAYNVSLVSGIETEYQVNPSCTATFIIE